MKWFKRKIPKEVVCRICGQSHKELPTDYGYLLPDDAFAQGEAAVREHLEWATDVCNLDGRWFLRGVLEIPFQFQEGRFGWGIWAEVTEGTMGRFYKVENIDASDLPREMGTIANKIPYYLDPTGFDIEVQFGRPDLRPLLFFPSNSTHELAIRQREGMDEHEYHELLKVIMPS